MMEIRKGFNSTRWRHNLTKAFLSARLCLNTSVNQRLCICQYIWTVVLCESVYLCISYTDTYLYGSGGSSLFLARSINTCFSQVNPFLSPTNNGGEFWKGFLIFIDSLFPAFSSLLELNSICHPLLQSGGKLDEKGNNISCSSF